MVPVGSVRWATSASGWNAATVRHVDHRRLFDSRAGPLHRLRMYPPVLPTAMLEGEFRGTGSSCNTPDIQAQRIVKVMPMAMGRSMSTTCSA